MGDDDKKPEEKAKVSAEKESTPEVKKIESTPVEESKPPVENKQVNPFMNPTAPVATNPFMTKPSSNSNPF